MSPSLLDLQFIGLLAGIIALRKVTPARYHLLIGGIFSAVLIGFASWATLLVLGGMGLFVLYPLGIVIHQGRHEGGSRGWSRAALLGGIIIVVAVMALMKVHRHFALPFLTGHSAGDALLLMFGYSYFLFRSINYLQMHYYAPIGERNPLRVLYYSIFPSTVTSGPIQKYPEFKQQAAALRPLDWAATTDGVYRITRGYFRKVCLAYYVDAVLQGLLELEAPMFYESLLIVVLLYMYFYFDFAGYSDIAIGFGVLLGFKIPENFRQPFLATSITEFWRNWHITLVESLRNSIFIPLGGMQRSRLQASLIAVLIMVLCGLWHEVTILMLIWGAYHGLNLFLEGVTGSRPVPPAQRHGTKYWGRVLFTNARAAFGCLLFLPSATMILKVLGGLVRFS